MMKEQDSVGVTFVNTVIGRGSFDGVINITLGVCNFTPTDTGDVDLDHRVQCRLRMGKHCAQQLHAALGALLEQINMTEQDTETSPEPKIEGVIATANKRSKAH